MTRSTAGAEQMSRRDIMIAAPLAAAATFGSSPAAAQAAAGAGSPARQRMQGKVALVTGAARGIGRACAVALATEGADVVALDLAGPVESVTQYPPATPADLAETVRRIMATGQRALSVKADVRDIAALHAAVERAIRELGRLDIVVANAGIGMWGALAAIRDCQWRDVIDINLTGVANTMRAALPHMIERGDGRIIAVASVGGRAGFPDVSAYCASKWGVMGLVKCAALELGRANVRVNAVCPTAVDTPMFRSPQGQYRSMLPELDRIPTDADIIPIMRQVHALPVPWVSPEDVAAAVAFLASDDARHITGSAVDVGAGSNARYTA